MMSRTGGDKCRVGNAWSALQIVLMGDMQQRLVAFLDNDLMIIRVYRRWSWYRRR
jgi:hypothetical protein